MINTTEIFKRDFSIPPSEAIDTSQPSFALFPSDLVFKILCQQSPDVLLNYCRKVCRQWKRVVKIMPPQMLLPGKSIAIELIKFARESVEFPNDRLNLAKLSRYRAALLAEPERVYTDRTVILLTLAAARAKPSSSRIQQHTVDGGNDLYYDCIKNIVICTRHIIGPGGQGCVYIDLLRVIEKGIKSISHLKITVPDSGKIKKIQHLLDKGILLTRIDWTANSAPFQLLIHQYTTGSCIFDSFRVNSPLPLTLLKTITRFQLLDTLAIRVVKENDAFKYVLLVAVKRESETPNQTLLQYSLG